MTTMAATYAPDRHPGQRPSPRRSHRHADGGAGGGRPAIRAYSRRKQPLAGEMMDPDEVAHAAVYFLSDESRASPASCLKVDGGWSRRLPQPGP